MTLHNDNNPSVDSADMREYLDSIGTAELIGELLARLHRSPEFNPDKWDVASDIAISELVENGYGPEDVDSEGVDVVDLVQPLSELVTYHRLSVWATETCDPS